jgi:hypothetical protein
MSLFPTYSPEKHLAQVQKQWASYRFNSVKECQWNTEGFHKFHKATIPLPIDAIFGQELIYMPAKPSMASREFLTRLQNQLCEERIDSAIGALAQIFHHIKMPSGKSSMSVPLYTLIPDFKEYVTNVLAVINGAEYNGHRTFPNLGDRLRRNVLEISGVNPDKPSTRPIVLPENYDGNPLDYLRETPFYDFFQQQVSFAIPRHRWETHAIAIAPSEWGKSELTGLFFREAVEDPQQRAVILCDPHGDLYAKAVPRVPPERLVAIDLTKDAPDLNILDDSVMGSREALYTFRFILSSLAGGLSPKQENCIRPLFSLLKLIPDATLMTLHDIVTEQVKRADKSKYAQYIYQLQPLHKTFFENLWYSGNFSETKDALQWKLTAALDDPTFNKMFSAKRNTIDVGRWLEEKTIVCIKSGDQLDKEGTRLFFLFLIGQYYTAAKKRDPIPEEQRELAHMFMDEASIVLQAPIIKEILTDLRKYKTSFWAATQLWSQIGEEVRPAVLGSTGIRFVGQLGHNEATALYRDMKVPLERITGLRNVPRSHAQWCMWVRTVADPAVVITAPYGVLEKMSKQKLPHAKTPQMPKPPLPDASKLKAFEEAADAFEKIGKEEAAVQKSLGSMIYDLVKGPLGLNKEEKRKEAEAILAAEQKGLEQIADALIKTPEFQAEVQAAKKEMQAAKIDDDDPSKPVRD